MKSKNVPRLNVKIGSIELKNPVMTASGTFGYGEEYNPYIDINRLGAFIVKGLSCEPRSGNPPPRIIETAAGMLNAVGLQNVGIDVFIKEKLPYLSRFDVAVITNIFGETIDEYVRAAEKLSSVQGIAGLEVNISCPNVKKGGIAFGDDPDTAYEVTRHVKKVTDLPIIVKLTPNVTDITTIARVVEDAGADAISLINTLKGMAVDMKTMKPYLKNITGGLSGPAIKPVALRMVWEVTREVSIPVIGVGGIMNAHDALEFLIVGATAIQIGTANFINPRATMDVLEGIQQFMIEKDISDIYDLIGILKVE
jgi:dihydroorotate dehydrogenase (NAD+) catalytic subunit